MDPITIAIGAGAIVFGSYTTYLRFSNPAKLGKLEPMRRRFGQKAGTAIHNAAYSVVPIVAGVALVVAGLNGVSFARVFAA